MIAQVLSGQIIYFGAPAAHCPFCADNRTLEGVFASNASFRAAVCHQRPPTITRHDGFRSKDILPSARPGDHGRGNSQRVSCEVAGITSPKDPRGTYSGSPDEG